MNDTYSNPGKCENFSIEDVTDCREKIKLYYPKWEESGFSEEWLKSFKKSWQYSGFVHDFTELLKAKRDLSDSKYKEREAETIEIIKKKNKSINDFLLVMEAEDEAFEKAGIDEGTVEYKCPICGGTAIANRYRYEGSYHGLGSGCPTCGLSHS